MHTRSWQIEVVTGVFKNCTCKIQSNVTQQKARYKANTITQITHTNGNEYERNPLYFDVELRLVVKYDCDMKNASLKIILNLAISSMTVL